MKINRVLVIGIPLVLAAAMIYFFREIVSYVLIAWVISMIGDPLMDFFLKKAKFEKLRWGTSLAAVLVLLIMMTLLVTLFLVFGPLVVEQARKLSEVDYQAIGESLAEPLNSLSQRLYSWGVVDEVRTPVEQIQILANRWMGPSLVGDFVGSIIGVAGNVLITLFSVLFVSFFFLKERGLFGNFMRAVVPKGQEDKTTAAIDEITQLLTRYFGGIVLQMLTITTFISLALTILGIKNAVLIGFFAAVMNVIPYVGPMIGAAFGVIVTITGHLDLDFYTQMVPMLVQVLIVFGCMQLLDNFILQPIIFSNSVKAHPLEIFIVILMGAKLGGIMGMILAIPAYTVFRVIAKVFLSEFKVVQKITEGMEKR